MMHPFLATELGREHANDLLREANADRLAAEFHPSGTYRQRTALALGHLLMSGGERLTRYAGGQPATPHLLAPYAFALRSDGEPRAR